MKNIATNKASFFKNIRNTVLVTGLGLAIVLMPSCKKTDSPVPQATVPTADYGSIHYTMTSYAGKVTKDEKLKSTSACHTGTQNMITLGDAYNRFSIAINGVNAAMKTTTYSIVGSAGSSADEYSTAKYNWTDVHAGKSGTANFTEGESEITDYRPNDKVVKVYFHYSLNDPDHNNELVTLDGYAVINNVVEHK